MSRGRVFARKTLLMTRPISPLIERVFRETIGYYRTENKVNVNQIRQGRTTSDGGVSANETFQPLENHSLTIMLFLLQYTCIQSCNIGLS